MRSSTLTSRRTICRKRCGGRAGTSPRSSDSKRTSGNGWSGGRTSRRRPLGRAVRRTDERRRPVRASALGRLRDPRPVVVPRAGHLAAGDRGHRDWPDRRDLQPGVRRLQPQRLPPPLDAARGRHRPRRQALRRCPARPPARSITHQSHPDSGARAVRVGGRGGGSQGVGYAAGAWVRDHRRGPARDAARGPQGRAHREGERAIEETDPMTYRPGGRVGRETHLVLLVLCVGCGATSAPPPTGTGDLTVSATTTGSNLDPDGYTVTIDGGASQAIGIAGSVTFAALGAGSHSVQLTGVAANCTVSGSNPQTVSVPAGGTAQVSWAVSCAAEAVLYTQQFTGSDGSDWPAPWAPIGGFIPVHDIPGNRGRVSSATGRIGRMLLGGFRQRDGAARSGVR